MTRISVEDSGESDSVQRGKKVMSFKNVCRCVRSDTMDFAIVNPSNVGCLAVRGESQPIECSAIHALVACTLQQHSGDKCSIYTYIKECKIREKEN